MEIVFLAIIIGILGASFGSFLCNWMDREEIADMKSALGILFVDTFISSIRSGKNKTGKVGVFDLNSRSVCMACGKVLGVLELFPIFSFIFLRGKCKSCKYEIPSRTLILEIVGAGIFVASYLLSLFLFGSTAHIVMSILLSLLLFVFFSFDYFYGVIPDVITFVGAFIFFIFSLYGLKGMDSPILTILAVVVGFLFFALQNWVSKGRAVGMGDAYLGLFLGAVLGFKRLLIMLLLAYVSGAIISVFLIIFKIKNKKDTVPFGVFLSSAAFIAWFFGDKIIKLLGF